MPAVTTYFNDEEYGKLIQEAKNRKKSVPALVAETVREAMPWIFHKKSITCFLQALQ